MNSLKLKQILKKNSLVRKLYAGITQDISRTKLIDTSIPEAMEIVARECFMPNDTLRINLLVPSIDVKHVFGGISTAIQFFEELCDCCNAKRRMIITDAPVEVDTMISLSKYKIIDAAKDEICDYQIVPFSDRLGKTVPVSKSDIFVATGWWTAYNIFPVLHWQAVKYNISVPRLIYMIQDYEPGFYPWSSRYLMADSTYCMDIPVCAIFNSKLLYNYFKVNGYQFEFEYYFEPVLNNKLKEYLFRYQGEIQRKKQVLVYGRPSVARNAFELIVGALRQWCQIQDDIDEWVILSVGERFPDVKLNQGKILRSIGKVSLEEYAKIMLETKVAISLMVSPHPSYPPLEMSTFGVKVITNAYAGKDLSVFNENIYSLKNCSGREIARMLQHICAEQTENKVLLDSEYVKQTSLMSDIVKNIKREVISKFTD